MAITNMIAIAVVAILNVVQAICGLRWLVSTSV